MDTLLTIVTILTALPSVVIGGADQYDLKPLEYVHEDCNDTVVTLSFSPSYTGDIGEKFISSPVLTCLNLENNSIKSIKHGSFSGVPNLRVLRLSGNHISNTDMFSFGNHENLMELYLDSQTSSYSYCCPKTTINGLYPNLRYLNLKNNKIYGINGINSNSFPTLKYIDLSGNEIEHIYSNEIFPCTLEVLDLSNNQLGSIALRNLRNLTVLRLDNNNIACVGVEADNCLGFLQLWNLKYLSLRNNQINSISAYMFLPLLNLEYLDLSSNILTTIALKRFDAPNLTHLILDSNLLDAIPQAGSSNNLKVLSLRFNMISNISNNDLTEFRNLTSLILAGNNITTIHADSFYHKNVLENLWLDGNKLSSLPQSWHKNLRNIKTLNLSNNNFTTLESIFYTNNFTVREVYLQNNPLKYITANTFQICPKKATLYFHGPISP